MIRKSRTMIVMAMALRIVIIVMPRPLTSDILFVLNQVIPTIFLYCCFFNITINYKPLLSSDHLSSDHVQYNLNQDPEFYCPGSNFVHRPSAPGSSKDTSGGGKWNYLTIG